MNSQTLARGLAFFGLGLGVAELAAPRQVARLIGIDDDNATLLRFLGLREIGASLGIMQGSSAGFMWGRVGGDALDLALLGTALRSRRNERSRVIGAISAVAAVTAIDVVASVLLSRNPSRPEWRVARSDRRGIAREDPLTMREKAEEAMAEQSGHWRHTPESRTPRAEIRAREESVSRQFGPGD